MSKVENSQFHGNNLMEGKRCAVTGAGSGIGQQIAYTLAEQGADVAILDYVPEMAEETIELIQNDFTENVFPVIADVSDMDALKDAFSEIDDEFDGAIDLFVNNAGINIPCRIEDLVEGGEAERAKQIMMVNEAGACFCASLAYPRLLKGDDPLFLLMGSCASPGSEGQGVYSATKASMRGLLGTLVKEWAATEDKQAVRSGLIEPDYFEATGLRDDDYLEALARSRRTSVDEVSNVAVAKQKVPMRREGRLEEIAETVVMMYLQKYANGNITILSGGKTVRP